MIDTISIILLLLTITFTLGGGLYETLVIYPNWKHAENAESLKAQLESSGQNNAGKRFWPLFSPAQGLLAIVNIILAWNLADVLNNYWLMGAVVVFINRLVTFAYFIPVMIRYIMQPEKVEPAKLKRIVKSWTASSPLRLAPEMLAWTLLILALIKF